MTLRCGVGPIFECSYKIFSIAFKSGIGMETNVDSFDREIPFTLRLVVILVDNGIHKYK